VQGLLPNAFITGVNSYLRRYAPKLINTERSHVTMHVNYAYPFDVELYVMPGEFQIMVTLSEDVLRKEQARATAEKVSAGVLRAMQKSLARSRKKRDGR